MKKNMLIRILSLVVVLACVFAFAGCYDDTEVKDSVASTQTSLEEAKTALNAAIDAVKNTADAAATKTALEEAVATLNAVKTTADAAATKAALDEAVAKIEETLVNYGNDIVGIQEALRQIRGIAGAAATQAALEEAIADAKANNKTLEEAIEKLDEETKKKLEAYVSIEDAEKAVETLKTEVAGNLAKEVETLNKTITDLNVDGKIADVQGQIDALKAVLGSIEGTEAGTLLERVVALENTVAAIDTDAFKKEYVKVTEILLGGEEQPKSFYNFLKIINDNIDFGGYDDESVTKYQRRVEEIKFALSRAVTLEEIDKAFVDLDAAEDGLVLLVDALAAKLKEITLINLSEDCTKKITDLVSIMDKINKKNEKAVEEDRDEIVVNPEDKAEYDLKTGAYETLKGFATSKGALIDGKINPIFIAKKVLLATDATNIGNATDLIAGLVADVLKVNTDNAEYFALYTNDVYENLYNIALADAVAELVAAKKEAYVNDGITAKANELKNAWIEAEVAARLAADDTLDETAVRAEVEAEAATKDAEFAVNATNEVKATLEAEAEAKTDDYKAEVQADAEVIAKGVADKQAATKVADTLYNKFEYTAVNTRYELLKLAKDDAIAQGGLLDQIKAIEGAWLSTRPAFDNSDKQDIADVVALMNAWIADAKYQNDTDFGTFTACTSVIEEDNVKTILGEDRLLTLAAADTYVKAMNAVYENNKVAELVANIKAAVNGNVDVDNKNIDTYIEAIAILDADISDETNWTVTQDGTKNMYLMVSQELRDRLTVINEANDKVLEALEALKLNSYDPNVKDDPDTEDVDENDATYSIKYKDGKWEIVNINAGKYISIFKDALAVKDENNTLISGIYKTVMDNSTDDNKITSVKSTIGEAELSAVQAKFEKFAEKAISAYNKANEAIDKIDAVVEANGMLTLDLGVDIYEALSAINKDIATGDINGLDLNTIFTIPVKDPITDEESMTQVQFRELYQRLNAYNKQYRELAEKGIEIDVNGETVVIPAAEAKAADLIAEINKVVKDSGTKLDNYNAIKALYNRVVNEYVKVYFVNMSPAKAVEETNEVKKVGGGTYEFITNNNFKTINDEYVLANKTYTAAKTAAEGWITSANKAIASYTFHDWAKFQEIESAYTGFVDKYYNTGKLNADTDHFGMLAAHNTFATHYGKCQTMANGAQGEINAIIDAIKALTAVEDITIDNYTEVRTKIDAVKALISAFETGYCTNAQKDTDFIVDNVNYNVVLAKAEAVVKIFEVGVAAIGETVQGTKITRDEVIDNASNLKDALSYLDSVNAIATVYESFETYVKAE